ncbi:MAG: DNA alkylation repair protein [Alteromonadaceae bacterium]|nr:DNA alkylation repair protein [Alteromonadaceae bacterium]
MSNLFKDIYLPEFYNKFSKILKQALVSFNADEFNQLIFNDKFEAYELKERMTHTAKVLNHFLNDDFTVAATEIKDIIKCLRVNEFLETSIEFMFFPEYISMVGIENFADAVSSFEFITQFTSCEFAVRPFLIKYPQQMQAQMLLWSTHENNKVRRLASEGSRPRLPWAMGLPEFKKDPAPILPILNNLKNDSCEVVRRSVANNLNDIAKDNPDVVINWATEFLGQSKETDALIKHACRTLLKTGDAVVLKLLGFDSKDVKWSDFKITTPKVKIGDKLNFSFTLINESKKSQKLRLEYGLYYKKQNGSLARKVFKISEREIEPGKSYNLDRNQSFKLISTRKFHLGEHQVSLIINGVESEAKSFELIS